ncbi:hypothetical protein [Corynebacterium halotolerans]
MSRVASRRQVKHLPRAIAAMFRTLVAVLDSDPAEQDLSRTGNR